MPQFPKNSESREFVIGPARVVVYMPPKSCGGAFYARGETWDGHGWWMRWKRFEEVQAGDDCRWTDALERFQVVFEEGVKWVKREGGRCRLAGVWTPEVTP